MAQGILFDIDGTLLDSNTLHAQAWSDAFREFGKKISSKEIWPQIGKGGDQLLPVFLTEVEIQQFGKQLEKRRGEIFKEHYLQQAKPFPNVRELFQLLLKEKKEIGLATSSKDEEVEQFKKILHIEDLIQSQTTKDDAPHSKPEPDIFQAALNKLNGISRHEAVVVGDTPYDVQAAKKIGLKVIGILCGGFEEELLRQEGADQVYRDPTDLMNHYEESILC
ncbi:MAG: family hydrolase [Verrucomicrobiales bacterium]|nr:family hydrolase [Verrucomicrobiales bacterium]